jgi:leucine dehydrogenase
MGCTRRPGSDNGPMISLLQDGALEHADIRVHKGPRSDTPFVIAIHTPGDGVALGGCRMLPSHTVEDALRDALALSRAMTFKGAAVGLRHGGAKCVIAAPEDGPLRGAPRRDVLLDVGDAVQELGGRFVTGKDAGTTAHDFEVMAQRTNHLVGRSPSHGGSGDPSGTTAYGVLVAIRASCEHAFGTGDLRGRRLAVLGLGKVGADVARRAARAGARLVVADVNPDKRSLADRLGAHWTTPEELLASEVDVLVPCALGGVIDADTVATLRCRVVAGAANNQLATREIADELRRREILWAPDFIANAGGLISVASEIDGYTSVETRRRTDAIGDALRTVFAESDRDGVSTLVAAERYAERRAAELPAATASRHSRSRPKASTAGAAAHVVRHRRSRP